MQLSERGKERQNVVVQNVHDVVRLESPQELRVSRHDQQTAISQEGGQVSCLETLGILFVGLNRPGFLLFSQATLS